MKILFLSDIVPYPPNTGIKIRTYNILKELYENGNEIYLLSFNHKIFISDKNTKVKYKKALERYCKEVHLFEIPSEENIILKYLLYTKNIFQREPYRVWRYFSDECISAINNIIEKESIDICHMDKLEFYKYSIFFNDIPIITTNHNVESDLMRQRVSKEKGILRKLFAYLQWRKTERYEQFALNRVDAYITCSEQDAIFFQTKYHIDKPNIVIENGVDVKHYQPTNKLISRSYFLIIGAQNKASTANFDATWFFFDEIWPIVKKKINISVKIVGRNPDKSIINFAKNDPLIEIEGYVDDERNLFKEAIALLVPLRIGGGTRLKILTAFGLGKLVISTTKGAEGIAHKTGCDIIIADSPSDFANHIIQIWKNPDIANNIGRNARRLVLEKYDWKLLGKRLHNFYNCQKR